MDKDLQTVMMTLFFDNGTDKRFRILAGSFETKGGNIKFINVLNDYTREMEIVTFDKEGFAGIGFPIKAEDALRTDKDEVVKEKVYRDPTLHGDYYNFD